MGLRHTTCFKVGKEYKKKVEMNISLCSVTYEKKTKMKKNPKEMMVISKRGSGILEIFFFSVDI